MPTNFIEGSAPSTNTAVFTGMGIAFASLVFFGIIQFSYASDPENIFPFWRIAFSAIIVLSMFGVRDFELVVRTARLFAPWIIALAVLSVRAVIISDTDVLLWALRNVLMLALILLASAYCCTRNGEKLIYGFLLWSMIFSFAACAYSTVPILQHGWSWDSARIAKTEYFKGGGLPFNIIVYNACVIFIVFWQNKTRFRYILLGILLFLSVVLATRTPILSALGAITIAFLIRLAKKWVPGGFSGILVATFTMIIIVAIPFYMATHPSAELTRETAGRVALWQAALNTWQQHAIFGKYVDTVGDSVANVSSSLYLTFDWEIRELLSLTGGGFHNLWIQNLTSFGIFGFVATFLTYWNVMAAGVRSRYGECLTICYMLILIRTTSEYSGLLCNERAESDMITALIISYGLSRVYLGQINEDRAASEPIMSVS